MKNYDNFSTFASIKQSKRQTMKIAANTYVSASYDLYVGGEDGTPAELMEKATAERPLSFVYGTGMMLEAFEKNISGLAVNDTFDFTLTSEEAYGKYDDSHVVDIPKSVFEVDGQIDTEVIFENNTVPMMDQMGNRMNGTIIEINEASIKMDFNHPLAGENLHFVGTVLDVHEATPEEMKSFFGGGCGGGCSCGDGGCDDDSCGSGCGSSCGCGN
jgi:FKBP-type peptidyl-prolyl cis-trans isomerase SlyD